MKRFWNIVAVACALVAVILLIWQDYDKAFVLAAVGAIAWFLNYRVQMREFVKANEPAEHDDDDWESDEDE